MKNFASLFTTLILVISSSAHASLFGPSNFDECVLEGIKNAKTDSALRLLVNVCSDKFIANKEESGFSDTDSIVYKECDSPRLRAYADWIVRNKDRKDTGDKEWDKVSRKFKEMRQGCR